MSNIAFIALWLFTFTVPWEDSVLIPGVGTLTRAAGMPVIILGILSVLMRRKVRPLAAVHVLAILFALSAGATVFWSIDPRWTRAKFQSYVQLALLLWLIWELAPEYSRQRQLLQAYVLGACVSALAVIAMLLTGATTYVDRFTAPGFNPNDLGRTLALAVPMAWYLGLSSANQVTAWLNRIYVPLAIAAITLTGSRGSLITLLVALLVIPWTLAEQRLRTKAATFVVLILSLYYLSSLVPQGTLERLATTTSEIRSGTLSRRTTIWRAGAQTFLEHPFLGTGAGTFNQAVAPILGWEDQPHQTFLAVSVGQGMLGLALFLAMITAPMQRVRLMPRMERKVWLVIMLTLAIALLASTWDTRKPVWILLGLLASHPARVPKHGR